jgi:hypothetical protein
MPMPPQNDNPVARPTETSFAEKGKQIAEMNADDSPPCSPRLRDRQLIRAWNADALAKRQLAAGLLSLEWYLLDFSSGTVSPKWRIAGCERAAWAVYRVNSRRLLLLQTADKQVTLWPQATKQALQSWRAIAPQRLSELGLSPTQQGIPMLLERELDMLQESSDRRSMRRFDMRLPASIRIADSDATEFVTETQNVSARGVFFYLDRMVAAGSRVEVTLTFPPHVTLTDAVRVRFAARVIRVETPLPSSRIGVAAVIEEYEFLRSSPAPDFAAAFAQQWKMES